MSVISVILAGGSGTRLWPLSRESFPKQFINLLGDKTLFQETVLRARDINPTNCIYIVSNAENYFICLDQLAEINEKNIYFILEPVGKNTAPAIAMAALTILKREKEKTILVMPSDHQIKEIDTFKKVVTSATESAAKQDLLLTFGVCPTSPKTGYGYIEKGEKISDTVFTVKRFVEKPSKDVAESFLKTHQFYWNSGIFLFNAQMYLKELQKYAGAIYETCLAAFESSESIDHYLRINAAIFKQSPSDSIDYAVMEKTERAAIALLNSDWSDLGCWQSVSEAMDTDNQGNTLTGEIFLKDTNDCYLRSEGRLIAALGLKNIIVISTPDAVLVANKAHTQSVKTLVDEMRKQQLPVANENLLTHRPWGTYEILSVGDNFKVKRITVNPGAKLSLQAHDHRAEHWVVVSGVADVVNGEEVFCLTANESTYISKQSKHRLSNSQKEPLVIIEIQSGDYLGEDDIKRFDDIYHRENK